MSYQFTVAIDLSKYKHTATIFKLSTKQIDQSITFKVNQNGFAKFELWLQRYSSDPSDFIVGCEATGHYGETLIRYLQMKKYPVVRMNPAQVVQFRRGLGHKAKTDTLDAEAMAKQLSIGNWTIDHEVSEPIRHLKSLTRLRLDFVEEQSRWINRIRALINQIYPEIEPLLKKLNSATSMAILSQYPSRKSLAEANLDQLGNLVMKKSRQNKGMEYAILLQQTAMNSVGLDDTSLEFELRLMMRQFTDIAESIGQLELKIREYTCLVLQAYSQRLKLDVPLSITSFAYGNYISIATLLAELGDIQRFSSLKNLLSYLGWCPNTQESGMSQVKHPRMSHRGNRFARRILWLMAVGAVRWVDEYRNYFYERVDVGKNKMKTLVAIGRKLLSVFYAVLKTGQPYDANRYLQHQALAIAS